MKEIPLTNSKLVALVDDEDFERISAHAWYLTHFGCAARAIYLGKKNGRSVQRTVYMHREIMKDPAGLLVDHHRHDKLDNRKSELRPATNAQNTRNRLTQKVKHGRKPSKFKGLYWHWVSGKWHATIRYCGKCFSLGYFSDETEGARAYNEAAKKFFGDFAHLNTL